MFSPQDPQAVLTGLGDKFLMNLASSVRGARADLAEPQDGSELIGWKPIIRPDLPAADLYDGAREEGAPS